MASSQEITIVKPDAWKNFPSADQIVGKNCLIKIYPDAGAGGMIELPNERFIIGRDNGSDLDLANLDVSRRHASIEPTEKGFLLVDLRSTNGTYVNNQLIHRRTLVAGDFVRIGPHILKFLSNDHIETQYHETIYSMMVTDGLTGARNRRFLLEALEKELARSRRHRRPLALAMIDLDHFKRINDSFGHLAGDNVLREFCSRISGLVREDEVLARFGGEEFAVILDEASQEQAKHFGERVRQCVAEHPFKIGDTKVTVTVSIGIGHTPGGEDVSVDQLIQHADRLLYQAKDLGRNRVCI